jgi:hypothetical protein
VMARSVSPLARALVAAWLIAIGIGVIALGALSLLKQGGIAGEHERSPAHWSVPRIQESWPDEDAGGSRFVPEVPRRTDSDAMIDSSAGGIVQGAISSLSGGPAPGAGRIDMRKMPP